MSALTFVLPPPANACMPKTVASIRTATSVVASPSFFFIWCLPPRMDYYCTSRYGLGGRFGLRLERLRELDAVAVGVEHVDDAHLAGELDHCADLDVLGAQPIGLGLDVVDVDHCHPAAGVGVALGDGDVHRASPEGRPAFVKIDEGLFEPENALV